MRLDNVGMKIGLLGTSSSKVTVLLRSGRTGSYLQMNRLSLRNNRLKFKTAGELPIVLEEFIEYTPRLKRKTVGCQHVTGWTCQHYDLNRSCPKTSPITALPSFFLSRCKPKWYRNEFNNQSHILGIFLSFFLDVNRSGRTSSTTNHTF
jgi:hypothetical protein